MVFACVRRHRRIPPAPGKGMSATDSRPTAWAYLVVSSEQQADTLDHQQTWASTLASEKAWQISRTFRGVSSGRDGTRGLLEELLEELRKTPKPERPDRVLMIRLDRLGRGLGLEALAAIAEIARLGVVIHTRQDGDYTLARASDSILPLMRVVTGAIENEARRDKARAVFTRRRASNLVVGNKRPYGLKLDAGKDVPQEPQAQAVRFAFELAVNGYGLAAIGVRLRSIAPPKIYVNGRTHQTDWTNVRVAKLLGNSAYCGTLIATDVWENVQALRAGASIARSQTRHPWPLSGSIHCGCGRLLIGSIHGSPPRRVYRCTEKAVHGKNVTYSARMLEAAFEDLLGRLTASPELEAAVVARSEITVTSETLRRRLAELDAAIARQTTERQRAWSLNERGLIVDVELARRLREIDAELRRLNDDRSTVTAAERALALRRENTLRAAQLVDEAVALWRDGDVERQRFAAQSLARALGGLFIDSGTLRVGAPPAPQRFKKARAR
jgi:DNA invertase Pin-like site-specific DNA recombinase